MNLLILSFLEDYCWELQLQLRYFEIFDIIWAILETLLSRSDLRENKDARWKIDKVVEKLIQLFAQLNKDSFKILIEEIIKKSLYFIASATEFNCLVLRHLIPFVRILSILPQLLLNKFAIETLSKVRDEHGKNLLHEAIVVGTYDANLYATVRLLLNAGCDPNAIDNNGNAPLHLLGQLDQRYWKGDLNTIAVLLLDFGAQLSLKNADGKTAVDLLIAKNSRNRNMDEDQGIFGQKLPNWCTELPTLVSLSARVIRRYRIPHLDLPATLFSLVEQYKIAQ